MLQSSGNTTLVVAALLVLALVFSASWIVAYVRPGGDPWSLLPWFGIAAAVILLVAFLSYVRRRGNDQ
jgi:hypothetical protein